jgi:putative PEP-CTERM system TPR-repeat lipoprotein
MTRSGRLRLAAALLAVLPFVRTLPAEAIALDVGKGTEFAPALSSGNERRIAALIEEQKLEQALQEVLALEKTSPDDPSVINMKGAVYYARGDTADARKSFERALALKPNYMSPIINLVQIDPGANTPAGARGRLQPVLNNDPDNTAAMIGMAGVASMTGNDADELAWLNRAIKSEPSEAKPRVLLVRYYLRANRDPAKALATAEDAMAALRDNPEILGALGSAQLAVGQTQNAIATYTRLVQQTHDDAGAYFALANAQRAAGDVVGARTSLNRAIALDPRMVAAKAMLGSMYLRSGRANDALALAQEAQKLSPRYPGGYELEGEVRMKQRNFAAAEALYAKVLQMSAAGGTMIRWHEAATLAGHATNADARLQQFVRERPGESDVRAYYARVLIRQGKPKAAMTELEAVAAARPRDFVTLNDLAELYRQQGDPRAAATAERAYQLAPQRAEVIDTLGWILVQEGDVKRATGLLQQASDMEGAPPEVKYHLAAALAKSGDTGRARRELERLLARNVAFRERPDAEALLRKLPN